MQKMYKTAESAVLLADVAALNIILTRKLEHRRFKSLMIFEILFEFFGFRYSNFGFMR
jgi:hypothetical protein